LNRQDFPLDRLEVIVVDNAFEKRTLDCSAYGFRVIRTPPLNGLTFRPAPAQYRRYNFSTARNTGIHLSSGAVLLFLDDDIHLAGDSLRIRYELHQCYPHAVIGGPRHDFDRRILSEGNAPGLDRLIHQCLDPDVRHFGMNGMLDQRNYYWNTIKDRLHEVTRFFSHTPYFNFIIGGNMSAEKSDLLGINGFDERYNGAYGFEDIDCCRRLVLSGANAVYCLSCAVFHENHSNTVKRFTPTIYSKNKILYRSLDIHALAANQGRWWWNKDSLLPITVSFEELSSCFRGFGVESFGELHRDTPGNAHIRFNRFPLHDPPSFLDGICESAEYSAQAALPRIAVNRLYPESTRVERRFVREFHKIFGYYPPVELVNRHTRSATCLDEALLGFLQSRDYYYNALYQSLFAGGREL
jgi:glycosyltransferase involved in cell wall biosynthesis